MPKINVGNKTSCADSVGDMVLGRSWIIHS
jgi:hypothetical protein